MDLLRKMEAGEESTGLTHRLWRCQVSSGYSRDTCTGETLNAGSVLPPKIAGVYYKKDEVTEIQRSQ